MFKKKKNDSNLCPIYEREEETNVLVLWNCPIAITIWSKIDSPIKKWSTAHKYFMEQWKRIKERLDVEEVELVAYVMKRIWLRRNLLIF